MKSCFTVSDNITKSLMGTTNFLWANCTKKALGSSLTDWMQGFFFDHSLSNLQRSVTHSSFLVLWLSYLFFFSSVFHSPSFFTSFSFLIFFVQRYMCHVCFLLSTFTSCYLSEKVSVAFSLYWLSFVWFYTNESFRHQKNKMIWMPMVF